jgi:hypothetical protein
MIYYQYSRKDAVNRAIISYDEYLRANKTRSNRDGELLLLNSISQYLSGRNDENIDKLLSGLLPCNKGMSVNCIDAKTASAFMTGHDSDRFNTFELLEFLYFAFIKDKTREIIQYADVYLNFFLAKFEATGKLFEEYSWNKGKGKGNYAIVDNYILFAVNLLMFYRLNKELKVLNTVLKANDLLDIFARHHHIKIENIPLIIYSFCSEMKEMENLYEARRFRLSAD